MRPIRRRSFVEVRRACRVICGQDPPLAGCARTKQAVHVADLTADSAYANSDAGRSYPSKSVLRTLLAVPMLKDGELIGAINIYRQEVEPFTDKQIALVQNFAAQAVIAIENTRLLNELRQSLEQQTATADVLARHQLVARRAGAGVHGHARKRHAHLRCEIRHHDAVRRRCVSRGGAAQCAAGIRRGAPPRAAIFPAPSNPLARVAADQSDRCKFPICGRTKPTSPASQATVILAELGGARTLIGVPMLKDGELVGVFGIYRQEVRPFTDKQIELVQNFAAQAVIAIENTRLLNELRQRTTTSPNPWSSRRRRRKCCASSVRRPAIWSRCSRHAGKCDAHLPSQIRQSVSGRRRELIARSQCITCRLNSSRSDQVELRASMTGESAIGNVAVTKQAVQIADAGGRSTRISRRIAPPLRCDRPASHTLAQRADAEGRRVGRRRSMFIASEVAPASPTSRSSWCRISPPRPSSPSRTRGCSTNCASARPTLLNRWSSRLRLRKFWGSSVRRLATLQPVFQAIVENAVSASFRGAMRSASALVEDGMVKAAAVARTRSRPRRIVAAAVSCSPSRANTCTVSPFSTASMLDISNVEEAPADMAVGRKNFLGSGVIGRAHVRAAHASSENELIGALSIVRVSRSGPLSTSSSRLLKTFAAQAVIAIENTRLLNELRQRTDDLSESLEQQTATSDVLGVISRSPGGYGTSVPGDARECDAICEADNASILPSEGEFVRARWPCACAACRRSTCGEAQAAGAGFDERPCDHAASKPLRHVRRTRGTPKPILPITVRLVELAGVRTILGVPMLQAARPLVGAIRIYRQEVRPFTDKQIELVAEFRRPGRHRHREHAAAQRIAAIAGAADGDGGRAARHQLVARRAGAGVPGHAGERDAHLRGQIRHLLRREGDGLRLVAIHGAPPAYAEGGCASR